MDSHYLPTVVNYVCNRRMFMFKNKPNDEEFDLSEMIDEYEEDSELRKKIEAMKQQSQHAPVNEDIIEEAVETDSALVPPYSKSLTDTRELPRYEESFNRNTFIDADETVDATRVMSMEAETEDDSDKTLVIMDNQKQRIFETEADDDQDGSIYMYDNREVDEEEITEEDIEEFLGDEEKTKKAKKSVDPNKMNKMITYVITGIVAVCLVVGVGFGVKMLIDNFNTEDTATTNNKKEDNKKEETNKPTDKKDDKKENNDTNDTNGNNGQTTPPPVDNSTEIAKINGAIKALETQIEGYNANIEEQNKILSENTINEDELISKKTELDNVAREIGNIETQINEYNTKCVNKTVETEKKEDGSEDTQNPAETKSPEDEFCSTFNLDQQNQTLSADREKLTTLTAEIKALEDKKTASTNARNRITELNNLVTDANNQITSYKNQLLTLE